MFEKFVRFQDTSGYTQGTGLGMVIAKRIVEAMPDGTGAAMIDGKMQDDATWKQAKVILDLAKLVATKDPERKALYGM